jgi:hypothetical protein
MPCMAKKKRGGPEKVPQVPFRPDDLRLVAALDAYADSIRRSRNMAINLLLEKGLEEAGFWPPPPEGKEG